MLLTFTRVASPIIGISFWQTGYKKRNEMKNLNETFVTESETYVKTTCMVLIALGILLDAIVWKYRPAAKLIYPYEMICAIIMSLAPLDFGHFENFLIKIIFGTSFIAYATSPKRDIPLSIATLLIVLIFCYPKVYTVNVFKLDHIVNVVSLTGFLTAISLIVTYIAQIRGKIGTLMFENLNLLDGMHEGLIVLSSDDNLTLQFANKPAT